MNNIKEKLSNLGFSAQESHIYLSLIEFGESRISNLSEKTKIGRTHLYSIIDDMCRKGMIKKIPTRPVQCIAISPKELVSHLKKYNEERLNSLNSLAAELENIDRKEQRNCLCKMINAVEGEYNVLSNTAKIIDSSTENIFIKEKLKIDLIGNHRSIYNKLLEKKRQGVDVRVYLECNNNSIKSMKKYREFEPKILNSKSYDQHSMIIIDGKITSFVLYDFMKKCHDIAFYINNKGISTELMRAFMANHICD